MGWCNGIWCYIKWCACLSRWESEKETFLPCSLPAKYRGRWGQGSSSITALQQHPGLAGGVWEFAFLTSQEQKWEQASKQQGFWWFGDFCITKWALPAYYWLNVHLAGMSLVRELSTSLSVPVKNNTFFRQKNSFLCVESNIATLSHCLFYN